MILEKHLVAATELACGIKVISLLDPPFPICEISVDSETPLSFLPMSKASITLFQISTDFLVVP